MKLKMKSLSYLLFLICIGSGSCGLFGEREEVQSLSNKLEELEKEQLLLKKKLVDTLREEYGKVDIIKAERQKQEGLLETEKTDLKNITQLVEKTRTEYKDLELKSIQLKEENTKLENKKDSVSNKVDVEVSKLEEITKKVEKLTKEEIELQLKKKNENAEIVILESKKNSIILENSVEVLKLEEVSQKVENMVKDNADFERKNKELRAESVDIESKKDSLNSQIDTKFSTLEEVSQKVEEETLKKDKLFDDVQRLEKEDMKLVNEKCKEHYTLWNPDFLSNNKKSLFTSIVTALLIGACLPFLIRFIPPPDSASEHKSFKGTKDTFKETSPSRLEHMSDDEDNSEMVPSSSVLPKRDLKYNYDRDCMEKNENPSGCLDYIREKYGIKMNLHKCWETLKECESIEVNLWKLKSDELILTKLLLKKNLKVKKLLLTFELFQTKLRDGFPHSDFEETVLDEEDNRIEAKLALQIYHGLPEFSV